MLPERRGPRGTGRIIDGDELEKETADNLAEQMFASAQASWEFAGSTIRSIRFEESGPPQEDPSNKVISEFELVMSNGDTILITATEMMVMSVSTGRKIQTIGEALDGEPNV